MRANALYTGNSATAWYLLADAPHQHHTQVYEGEQKAIIDPALWMRTRAALSASARANPMDVGTTADAWLINAGNWRQGAGGVGEQVPLAECHCGLLSTSRSQQCDEPFLLEVPVVRQCVGDAVVRHREERDAIDEAVALVLPVFVENESAVEGATGLLVNNYACVLADAFDEVGR